MLRWVRHLAFQQSRSESHGISGNDKKRTINRRYIRRNGPGQFWCGVWGNIKELSAKEHEEWTDPSPRSGRRRTRNISSAGSNDGRRQSKDLSKSFRARIRQQDLRMLAGDGSFSTILCQALSETILIPIINVKDLRAVMTMLRGRWFSLQRVFRLLGSRKSTLSRIELELYIDVSCSIPNATLVLRANDRPGLALACTDLPPVIGLFWILIVTVHRQRTISASRISLQI